MCENSWNYASAPYQSTETNVYRLSVMLLEQRESAMDLSHILDQLHAERQRLVLLIVNMEALLDGHPPAARKRRGRKFMGPEERKQVGERIKPYWAKRRKQT